MKQHFFLTLMFFFFVAACSAQTETGVNSVLMQKREAPVMSHPALGEMVTIENAHALLLTDDNGASMSVRTSLLVPGHVYTAWWVIVNKPEACAGKPCTPSDVLSNTEVVKADM